MELAATTPNVRVVRSVTRANAAIAQSWTQAQALEKLRQAKSQVLNLDPSLALSPQKMQPRKTMRLDPNPSQRLLPKLENAKKGTLAIHVVKVMHAISVVPA